MANSIHPNEVAQVILNAVNSPSPNIRYSVGKDGESILKNRAQLSDVEMEKWARRKLHGQKRLHPQIICNLLDNFVPIDARHILKEI